MYNIRTVGTHKLVFRQQFFHALHTDQRHDTVAVDQLEAHIVLQSFNIKDVVKRHTNQLIVTLHENETVRMGGFLLFL